MEKVIDLKPFPLRKIISKNYVLQTTLGASPPTRTFHLKVRLILSPFTFALAGTECWNRCWVCPSMKRTSPSPKE